MNACVVLFWFQTNLFLSFGDLSFMIIEVDFFYSQLQHLAYSEVESQLGLIHRKLSKLPNNFVWVLFQRVPHNS